MKQIAYSDLRDNKQTIILQRFEISDLPFSIYMAIKNKFNSKYFPMSLNHVTYFNLENIKP